MAFKEQEIDKVVQRRAAYRLRRQGRERRDRQEGESWTGSGAVTQVNAPITQAINANPRDAARLRKSREQVRRGEVHWGVEDDESHKSDAGG